MKKLIENCKNHSYVYLKDEVVVSSHPTLRLLNKQIYVCIECGVGLEVYDLDNPITVKEPQQ